MVPTRPTTPRMSATRASDVIASGEVEGDIDDVVRGVEISGLAERASVIDSGVDAIDKTLRTELCMF